MNANLMEIEEQARQMNAQDRAHLAYAMLESLEPCDEGDLVQVWEAEFAARWQELEQGSVKPIPASEVFDGLRDKLR